MTGSWLDGLPWLAASSTVLSPVADEVSDVAEPVLLPLVPTVLPVCGRIPA